MYINLYKNIPRSFFHRVRELVRSYILDLVSIRVKHRNKNLLKVPRVQFVYIHHVFDDEIDKFDKLISDLKDFYEFIPFSEAVKRVYTNDIDRPYLAFSSDDGFKSNLTASKVLKKHNISACFFICTDFIGLNDIDTIKYICKNKFHLPAIKFMTWNDINYLISCKHEVGSHTTDHSNLSSLNFNRLNSVINDSFLALKKKIGHVSHFSFPYGTNSHFTEDAREIVSKAGYISCTSAIRGCHVKQSQMPNDTSKIIIKRDLLNSNYNINHVLYFMVNNIKNERA